MYGVTLQCLCVCFYCYHIFSLNIWDFLPRVFMFGSIYLLYFTSYSTLSWTNVYYSSLSIRMTEALCELNRSFYGPQDLKTMKVLSWAVLIFIILYWCFFVIQKIVTGTFDLTNGPYITISTTMDVEILQTVIIIYMISQKIKKWTACMELINFENDKMNLANEELRKMHDILQNVSKIWNLLKKTTRWTVSI